MVTKKMVMVECSDPHAPQGVFEIKEKLADELIKNNPSCYKIFVGGTTSSIDFKKKKKGNGD